MKESEGTHAILLVLSCAGPNEVSRQCERHSSVILLCEKSTELLVINQLDSPYSVKYLIFLYLYTAEQISEDPDQ